MMKKFKCQGCGYIHDGDTAPAECPKCGATTFEELDAAAVKLIERSRHTNMLHVNLINCCREIESLCKNGIDDDLDPGCVDVFKKALDQSYVIMKMSMAELAIHQKKGKWS